VHELRPADLAGAPGLERARGQLSAALDRRYLLTWVAEVEVGFLARIFRMPRWIWRRRTVDVARLSVALDRAEGRTVSRFVSLAAACERHGVPVESPHHALDDAVMTAELFLVIATKLFPFGYRNVASLLRESAPRPFDA
jgi:DNA polymerase-3 subunit epsilon